MVDNLLIDMIFVKVKIFPEFRRAGPSMSQCILELQIDFPSMGLNPPHEIFPKMPRPLSLETGVLVDNSTGNG
jgi:hypothetical protein